MNEKYYDEYGNEMSKEQFDKNRRELLQLRTEEMKNPENCITFEELKYYLNNSDKIK